MRPAGVRSWLDLRMADSSDKETNTNQFTNRPDKHKLIWQAKTDKRNRPHKRKLSYWSFRQKQKSWNRLKNIFESLWGDRTGDQTDSRDWIGLNLNQDHGSPRLRQKDHRNSIRERPWQVFTFKKDQYKFLFFLAKPLFLTDIVKFDQNFD